ncbi:AtpZ/AtpI family protein [Variovorax sp. PAMC 28711]|uniref:AtpZ/AtpI family protein n=1 Tax=Variovorax sp. PAMC 28711 TaxID=1795631 RepID=UPI00078E0E53|nr:AtpZ/AtpI family protein [Variovorax sp. PAMC 28711]AMM23559.1 ATP synthase [Variovorax sp. PAMC 28711]
MADPRSESERRTARAHTLADEVGTQAARKLKARRDGAPGVFFGLGMMGLVGWSVAVPTLLGAALGVWLDRHHPGAHPWTLALLVGGLALGCLNAWHWVTREDRAMHEGEGHDDA